MKKIIHREEKEIVSWARESVVTVKNIKKNEYFTKKNISVKRPAPKKMKYLQNFCIKF